MGYTATPRVANPWSRLGLAPGAPLNDVKRAYRRLAMRVHPDRAGSGDLHTFLAVKAAYEWIIAHPSVVEPGDRRPGAIRRPTVAPGAGREPSIAANPVSGPAPRSSWPGGRWYWEGRHDRGSRR
jgi:hypothetical protein